MIEKDKERERKSCRRPAEHVGVGEGKRTSQTPGGSVATSNADVTIPPRPLSSDLRGRHTSRTYAAISGPPDSGYFA